MKNLKKCIPIAICYTLCFMMMPMSVNASKSRQEEIISNKSMADARKDSVNMLLQPRGALLTGGFSDLVVLNSGLIGASASTYCSSICDTVVLNMYVERLIGNNWITYTSRLKTVNNASSVDTYIQLLVPKGYYYRVTSSHVASRGGVTETGTTHSSSFLVN